MASMLRPRTLLMLQLCTRRSATWFTTVTCLRHISISGSEIIAKRRLSAIRFASCWNTSTISLKAPSSSASSSRISWTALTRPLTKWKKITTRSWVRTNWKTCAKYQSFLMFSTPTTWCSFLRRSLGWISSLLAISRLRWLRLSSTYT